MTSTLLDLMKVWPIQMIRTATMAVMNRSKTAPKDLLWQMSYDFWSASAAVAATAHGSQQMALHFPRTVCVRRVCRLIPGVVGSWSVNRRRLCCFRRKMVCGLWKPECPSHPDIITRLLPEQTVTAWEEAFHCFFSFLSSRTIVIYYFLSWFVVPTLAPLVDGGAWLENGWGAFSVQFYCFLSYQVTEFFVLFIDPSSDSVSISVECRLNLCS